MRSPIQTGTSREHRLVYLRSTLLLSRNMEVSGTSSNPFLAVQSRRERKTPDLDVRSGRDGRSCGLEGSRFLSPAVKPPPAPTGRPLGPPTGPVSSEWLERARALVVQLVLLPFETFGSRKGQIQSENRECSIIHSQTAEETCSRAWRTNILSLSSKVDMA